MDIRSTVVEPENTEQRRRSITLASGWWSDWGNLALVGLAVYVLLYLLSLSFAWSSTQLHAYAIEFGFIPVILLGILFVVRAIRVLAEDAQTRQAWILVGVALGLLAIADSIWAWHIAVERIAPFPSIADLFYFSSMALLIIGVLRFPAPPMTAREFKRVLVDSAIILVGGAALIGYLVIGPEVLIGSQIDLTSALMIAYPVADLMLIIAALTMILRRPRAGKFGVLSLLTAGVIMMATANLWWVYSETHSSNRLIGMEYALWMIGYALLAASPQRQADVIRRQLPRVHPGDLANRIRSYLPYVAAAVAFIVFLTAAGRLLAEEFGILLGFLLVLATLVVVRQVMTLRENTRFQIERVRQEGSDRIRALIEHSSDMIAVIDSRLDCQFQSPSSLDAIGMAPEQFIGTNLLDWVDERDQTLVQEEIDRLKRGADSVRFEWRMRGVAGRNIVLETIASNELETPGVLGIVLNSRDMSDRKQLEDQLTFQAFHDPLTGLPNRTSFLMSLDRALQTAEPGRTTAIMFIDLDHFKTVNDTLGHTAGDELIKQVAERLCSALRNGDILSRFAGDEFTVLLPNTSSSEKAMAIAERLRQAMERPFDIAGNEVSISSSIGVDCTETPGMKPRVMLRQADAAMYAAKRNGRNRAELYEDWMEEELASLEEQRTQNPSPIPHR
jgi:diguanylate cyclase (GGDEF)-like protein/PAS domain S-box-containing protein